MNYNLTKQEMAECFLKAALDASSDGKLDSASKLAFRASTLFTDAAFERAGHVIPEATCNHSNYKSIHGRNCPDCGTVIWDAGD